MEITARTRLFAVLGGSVAHSLSPEVQNAAFQAAGVDGVYVSMRCDADAFPGLLRGLALAGGGGNVTLPHKLRAATLLDVGSESVRRTGACNTFWSEDGRVHGDNTDVAGIRGSVAALVGGDPEGARVLLLGAGGAARAAAVALLDGGATSVEVLNRTPERARELREDLADARVTVLEDAGEAHGPYNLIVNATSLGLAPTDPLPLDLDAVGAVGGVVDLVYGRTATPLVREATRRKIPCLDGAEILVRQGAASFRRWWGSEAPLDAMRGGLGAARGS